MAEDNEDEDAIQALAKERTALARERTVLAHIRTGFASFLFGTALVGLFPGTLAYYAGLLFILAGLLFLGTSGLSYLLSRKRMRHILAVERVARRRLDPWTNVRRGKKDEEEG